MNIVLDIGAGLFLIALGFLVVKFPMLISGYNTMSKEQRDKVDVANLSRMMRRWLIIMGISLIIGSIIINKMALLPEMKDYLYPIVILSGVLIMLIKAQKYNP